MVKLKSDDKRVGSYNPDGTVKSWPKLNIMGQDCEDRRNSYNTMRRNGFFVVVPPNWSEEVVIERKTSKRVSGGDDK